MVRRPLGMVPPRTRNTVRTRTPRRHSRRRELRRGRKAGVVTVSRGLLLEHATQQRQDQPDQGRRGGIPRRGVAEHSRKRAAQELTASDASDGAENRVEQGTKALGLVEQAAEIAANGAADQLCRRLSIEYSGVKVARHRSAGGLPLRPRE